MRKKQIFCVIMLAVLVASVAYSQNVGGDLSGSLPNPSVVKIQGQSVSATAPTLDQILKWNGTSYLPSADGITLPYSGSASLSGTTINLFKIDQTNTAYTPHMLLLLNSGSGSNFHSVNSGTGKCASFYANNSSNPSDIVSVTATGGGNAFIASNQGTGNAGYFQVSNFSSPSDALKAETFGSGNAVWALSNGASGKAGNFSISNTSNPNNTLTTSTSGTGYAISASTNNANGKAGNFSISSTTNSNTCLSVSTTGTGKGISSIAASGSGVYGSSTTGYAFYSNGNSYKTTGGSTWSIPSDIRLKKDVIPFTDGLSVIEKIEPKKYHYNGLCGTNDKHDEIGIIAQEIQKVAPYTITPRLMDIHPEANDGMGSKDSLEILTYNSGALIYVSINAIKELNIKLENKVSELNAKLQELESKILLMEKLDPKMRISNDK